MKLRHTITYQMSGSRPLYQLMRKSGEMETDICEFCGTTHIHGTDPGHRVSHCADEALAKKHKIKGSIKGHEIFITAPDGTKLYENDGYIIKSY